MKRFAVVAARVLALAACAPKPHDIKITPELLGDPAKVQSVTDRLDPSERPVFARYLLSRAAAASPLGAHAVLILAPGGKDPATVGEALVLTRKVIALELERDLKQDAATKRQEAISSSPAFSTPEGIAQYNAAVHDYNAASETFDAKLKAMQAAQ
jgi:hypothetical protein